MASHREHQGSISSSVPPALAPGSPRCCLFSSRVPSKITRLARCSVASFREQARTRIKVYHATPAEPPQDDPLDMWFSLRIRDVI